MTAIAALPQQGTDLSMPVMPATAGIAALDAWVEGLAKATTIAQFLARSNFVPTALRMKGKNAYKTVEELTLDVTAIILAGASVGYDPFQAVQQMFIVHGSPAMYARSMVALVKSHGHQLDQGDSSPTSVTVRARHRDRKEWHEFTWTYERADRAGYTSNPKYRTNPQEMLYAKAATEACRRMFPEVLAGISPYSVEESELEDLGETEPAEAAAPIETKPKRTVTRKKAAAAPAPELPAVVNEAPEEEAEAAADAATGEILEADAVDWFARIEPIADQYQPLVELYKEAKAAGADQAILDSIAAAGTEAKKAAA